MAGRFTDQLARFIEMTGAFGILAFALVSVTLILLAAVGRRDLLLALFLLALPFSGSVILWLNSGSTLFRWSVMIVLALTALSRFQWPGLAAFLMGFAACLGIPMGLGGIGPMYILQKTILFVVMMGPMAASLAYQLQDIKDVHRVMRYFIIAAAVLAVLSVVSLPQLRAGERFAGATTSAPLFVMTGGLFLAFSLWGAIQFRGFWRGLAIVTFLTIAMTNVISGQRAGTVAGFIACLALLMRFKFKRMLAGVVVVLAVVGGIVIFFKFMPDQASFVYGRYFEEGSSGRVERWQYALQVCSENLLAGHGMGSAGWLPHTFHNGYLSVWYDAGIIGLMMFLLAFALTGVRCLQVFLYKPTQEIGRLFIGILMALMFMAMLEESVWSPSNVAGSVMMILMVMSTRMVLIIKDEKMLLAEEWDEFDPDEQYDDPGPAFGGQYDLPQWQ